MPKICVEVTRGDIANGRRGVPCDCALALALSRAIGHAVSVGSATFAFIDGRAEYFLLPEHACIFVRNFDEGEPVSPFAFDIGVPE